MAIITKEVTTRYLNNLRKTMDATANTASATWYYHQWHNRTAFGDGDVMSGSMRDCCFASSADLGGGNTYVSLQTLILHMKQVRHLAIVDTKDRA